MKKIASFFDTSCITVLTFFTDDSYQFFQFDPDVRLSALSNHAEITLTRAERKAF